MVSRPKDSRVAARAMWYERFMIRVSCHTAAYFHLCVGPCGAAVVISGVAVSIAAARYQQRSCCVQLQVLPFPEKYPEKASAMEIASDGQGNVRGEATQQAKGARHWATRQERGASMQSKYIDVLKESTVPLTHRGLGASASTFPSSETRHNRGPPTSKRRRRPTPRWCGRCGCCCALLTPLQRGPGRG